MSHIVTIKSQIKDPLAIGRACARLELGEPTRGTARLYNTDATGIIVKFPGWVFPVVIETATGTVHYDNYGGQWGNIAQLNAFRQAYAIEKAKAEATRKGHRFSEIPQADGSVKLEITTR